MWLWQLLSHLFGAAFPHGLLRNLTRESPSLGSPLSLLPILFEFSEQLNAIYFGDVVKAVLQQLTCFLNRLSNFDNELISVKVNIIKNSSHNGQDTIKVCEKGLRYLCKNP